MDTTYLYLNGDIIPTVEAAISPLDIGLLRGYAVFDLLRTAGARPFMLEEHLKRLRHSAAELGLEVPVSDEAIRTVITRLLELNRHGEATVRLVLTGGVSPEGMTYDPTTPTFLILTHELHELPASLYETGAALILHEHRREIPAAKTTNYLTMLKHRPLVNEAGAIDLLYHDGERVLEAASASVYFVHGGTILAPERDVLWGTVGSLTLELARERYETRLAAVSLDDAFRADEVFLTSTTRGVVPIVRIDDRLIGSGEPGPVTRDLSAHYQELLTAAR
jgi:branched-subunit amino acid aminotransferase/4-amino-4-deoxychorismate lyase